MKGLLGALASLAAVVALSACGGGETTTVTASSTPSGEATTVPDSGVLTEMTKDQWLAVKLGSSRDQVIEQVGKPTGEDEYSDLDILTYTLSEPEDTNAAFTVKDGELADKRWTEAYYTQGTITQSQFEKVEFGMTEKDVEDAIGPPNLRIDEYTTYSEPTQGQNPPGTLQRCFSYQSRQENTHGYAICFSTSGKVNWTYPRPGETLPRD